MPWQPRWRHVTQLFRHEGDGPHVVEGANDCYEACLARYLREMSYPFAGDDAALVAAMRLLATGQLDHAGQGYTSLEQGGRALDALGIPWRWTTELAVARTAAWAIYWVRPARLRTSTPNVVDGRNVYTDYPLWWLGARDQPDHFILALPNGSFNDPLSYWNGGRDSVYTPGSVAAAFAGAYLLDGAPRGPLPVSTGSTPAASADAPALVVSCAQGLHLREEPALAAPVLATLNDGEALTDAYKSDCLWSFVQVRGLHGWVRREYVKVSG
jgi:hypothetical protein